MKLLTLTIALLAGLCLTFSQVNADLVVDNFNRPDGPLTGTLPTPGPGGVWTNHSGTAGDLLISGGEAVIQHGVPSEDTHTAFAGQTTGTLFASFDVRVEDDAPIGGSDAEYFAHFMRDGSNVYRARLDVVAGTQGGDYTFGISSGSSTAEAIFGTDFNFGDVVNVGLGFDLDTGIGSLTIGGTTINGTGIFLDQDLDSFALRQSDSTNNETIFIDNLVVTNLNAIPEPGSLGIIGLIGIAGLIRRRR